MSDILLGHSQFGQSEREKDMHEPFEEAIEESVVEHSRLVILAGDLFTCLIEWFVNNKIGNELFIISIPVCFVPGAQDVPIP
jgi:hypothetical protein